jgi:hypothetical protein
MLASEKKQWTSEQAHMNKKESSTNIPCHIKVYYWRIPMPRGLNIFYEA